MQNPRPPLRRPRQDRIIAGVCSAIAAYLGIHSTWVRLAFLLALFPGSFVVILIYLGLWFLTPSE